MRTRVIGLGNVLTGDDALGPYVVRVLEAHYELDDEVAVEDLGTPGLDLVPHVAGAEALIVVDTVRAEGAPGELRLYRLEDLLRHAPQPRTNPHEPGLPETLLTLRLQDACPHEVLLVGVIPADLRTGTGLSPALRRAVPAAVGAVLDELVRLGHTPFERVEPARPDLWWERPPATEPPCTR